MIVRHAIVPLYSPFNSVSNDILKVVLKYFFIKRVKLKIVGDDTIFRYYTINKIFLLYF